MVESWVMIDFHKPLLHHCLNPQKGQSFPLRQLHLASSSLSVNRHGFKHCTMVSYLLGVDMMSLIFFKFFISLSSKALVDNCTLSICFSIAVHAPVVPRRTEWKLSQSMHKQPVSMALIISHGALVQKIIGAVLGILGLRKSSAISGWSRINVCQSSLKGSYQIIVCLASTWAG